MNRWTAKYRSTLAALLGILIFAGSIVWVVLGMRLPKAPGLFDDLESLNLYGREKHISVASTAYEGYAIYDDIESTDKIVGFLRSLEQKVVQTLEITEPTGFYSSECDLQILSSNFSPISFDGQIVLYTSQPSGTSIQTYLYILEHPLSQAEYDWLTDVSKPIPPGES